MKCKVCKNNCVKAGRQCNGKQKYFCKNCHKYQQKKYRKTPSDRTIVSLLKEGCGIRSMSRILGVSPATITRRIKRIAGNIEKPKIVFRKEYEVDELYTYIKSKSNKYWIAYALRKDTREVIDFRVGKRTNKTLRPLIELLVLSNAIKINTDGLPNYKGLIPDKIHQVKRASINYIERKNLTLRTHLKRLNRRTICFSRSIDMLISCLKVFFWA